MNGSTSGSSPDPPRVAVQAQISAAMPTLRPTEARVARLVVDNPETVIYQSVAEVAAAAEVSPATVVRCAKQLGFGGFHELKLALARDLAMADRVGDGAEGATASALARITAASAASVRDAGELVSDDAFEEAVGLLAHAERIVFVGVGTSALLAQDAAFRFRSIGLLADAPGDVHVQHVAARLLRPSDVCVAISHTGSAREVLAPARAARAAGARVVAITSFLRSPLTELADVALVTGARGLTFRLEAMAGRLGHMAVIDALIVAVAEQDSARAQAALGLFTEAISEHLDLFADRLQTLNEKGTTDMQLKRISAIAVGVLTLALGACGSETATTSDTGAATDAASASTGCGYGIVFPTPIGPNQSARALDAGFRAAAEDAGEEISVVESTDNQSFIANLKALAAKRCHSAIGTVFFSSSTALQQVARQFPEQRFFIVDGYVEAPNVTNFAVAPEQLTYIAGAMAAQLSESKKIGVVLGDDSPTLQRFGNGFEQGAQLIDPSVEVKTSIVGSFTDPAKAATLAVAQASQDVDLIYPASGSNLEILAQASDDGYRAIASDPTEYAQARAKDAAIAFVALIDQQRLGEQALKALADGGATRGVAELGLAEGVFDIPGVTGGSSPYPLSDKVIAAGKRAYDGLKSGELTVKNPTGS